MRHLTLSHLEQRRAAGGHLGEKVPKRGELGIRIRNPFYFANEPGIAQGTSIALSHFLSIAVAQNVLGVDLFRIPLINYTNYTD